MQYHSSNQCALNYFGFAFDNFEKQTNLELTFRKILPLPCSKIFVNFKPNTFATLTSVHTLLSHLKMITDVCELMKKRNDKMIFLI